MASLPPELMGYWERLSPHRRRHSYGVEAIAGYLAHIHGVSWESACLAGLAHDLAREMSVAELIAEARRLALNVDREEWATPILLHGPIAAAWLEKARCGNADVWNAVRYHTTGLPDADPLTQVVFIADAVEPGRRYAEREALLKRATQDLGAGYLGVLESSVAYCQQVGVSPHGRTLAAITARRSL